MTTTVLVTGGAGYIGSHTAHALCRCGFRVLIVDDLSNGHRELVPPGARLEQADVTTAGLLRTLAERESVGAILHFVARAMVGESMERPDLYYDTNLGATLRVCEAAAARGIPVVFSSSCSIFGQPKSVPIRSDQPCQPQSPYGASKWMCERIIADHAQAFGFTYAALRYFNAAGADPAAGLFERHAPESHLIPLAIDAARGVRPPLQVFGADWPTPDGTCVRDYVHVIDLADAHVRALEHLLAGKPSLKVNLGAGTGTSVRQVIDAVARAVERPVPHTIGPRRPGDPAELVADISDARMQLDWVPRLSDIDRIVGDAAAVR
jgi:UDP-arabinose 4-epimerase